MDNTKKFSDRAESYAASRPAYAGAFIDDLREKHGFAEGTVAADIGCGTGKFAEQLLSLGCTVIGVEPNADMREAASALAERYDRFSLLPGSDTATGIDSGTADAVTAAQAFHWFDPDGFRKECRRILKPGGKVFLIWNSRDMDAEVNREWHDLFKVFCPDFKGFSGGFDGDKRISGFFGGIYSKDVYPNELVFTRETFAERCRSASYSLTPDDERYEGYMAAVDALFDKYSENGKITIPNSTFVYYGSPGGLYFKKFDHLCDDARRIRESVFVEEQGFKEEFDDIDGYAKVIVFYDNGKPVGICRYFKSGDTYHIGRIAVIPEYRGSGLGSEIVRAAEREIIAEGGTEAELSAQRRAEGFYKNLGYEPEGEPYYEEYCEHIRMRRKLDAES